jgi:hypothetical protein
MMYENLDIVGPYSIGPEVPQPMYRPISAVSPSGPVSIPWPVREFRQVQPSLGFAPGDLPYQPPWWQRLIDAFVPYEPVYPPTYEPPPYVPPPGVPTFPVDVYAPHCQSIWPWVLGAAAIGLLLGSGGGGNGRK